MSESNKEKDLREMASLITPGAKQPWVVWPEDEDGKLAHPKQVWLTPRTNVAGHIKMEELPDVDFELYREPVGKISVKGHPLKSVVN